MAWAEQVGTDLKGKEQSLRIKRENCLGRKQRLSVYSTNPELVLEEDFFYYYFPLAFSSALSFSLSGLLDETM